MQFILASPSSNFSNWLNFNWRISPMALHHWLPLHCRVNVKIILFVLKCLNILAPPYLSELLHCILLPDQMVLVRCTEI